MTMRSDDKTGFAKRLKLALTRNPKQIATAAELALQFNLRHPNASITQQAAQKWLTGQARPTLDKIETLAAWLNVSTHWLMYGPPTEKRRRPAAKGKQGKSPSDAGFEGEDELHLAAQFRKLSDHQRRLVIDLIDQLALEREAWPGS